ncbi:hypothetical protein KAR91_42910 [Candidatus Pacearchaeota archaeon]|nr:hypothetical protein [Candidatus Pacearchaeota archaeon]
MENKTKEEIIKQVVQCRAFRGLITIETCQQSCKDFGGIHQEPVYGKTEKGKKPLLRHDPYIKCNRPRLLPFMAVGEVLTEEN